MQSISALLSSHVELSSLTKQLLIDQDVLTSHKFLESPANQSMNSHYFPFYALVERYIGSTIEYTAKLEHFKELLVDSLQRRQLHERATSDIQESEAVIDSVHDQDGPHSPLRGDSSDSIEYATAMSSTPVDSFVCEETYLPTIDEDKETVYSYPFEESDCELSNDSDSKSEDGHNLQYEDSEFIYSDESQSGPDSDQSDEEPSGHAVNALSIWGNEWIERDTLSAGNDIGNGLLDSKWSECEPRVDEETLRGLETMDWTEIVGDSFEH